MAGYYNNFYLKTELEQRLQSNVSFAYTNNVRTETGLYKSIVFKGKQKQSTRSYFSFVPLVVIVDPIHVWLNSCSLGISTTDVSQSRKQSNLW